MKELNYKFKGHGTFYIRKGWIYKGLKAINSNPLVFTDKNVNTSDVFGIGVSMVKALRYWLQAVGLTVEEKSNTSHETIQKLTPLGILVNKYDRNIEEIGTLSLLHYKLATNKEMATAWYYFFNEFNSREFTKDDFVESLSMHLKFEKYEVSAKTIEDDFSCILNTYTPKKLIDPEDNMECPFCELGLIAEKGRKEFIKTSIKSDLIPLYVMLAIIIDQHKGEKEIKISDLLRGEKNIGKVFNLDFMTLSTYLDNMQKEGLIKIVRTAGLDVIRLNIERSYEDCILDYYLNI